ncbi:MAG: peptidyl-prolyl cis-trans isomerase [Planctomycetota bacterium]
MKAHSPWFSCRWVLLSGALTLAGNSENRADEVEVKPYELAEEVVCKVNTETISKRQVEENMDEIMLRLTAYKRALEAGGQWDARAQKEYDAQYSGAFREALRRVVRQRLMLQYAKEDKYVKIEEPEFQKRLKETLDRLRAQKLLNAKGFTEAEVEKHVRDAMLVEMWTGVQFGLNAPGRPEVRRYYHDNLARFARPAGVMVRIIVIHSVKNDKLLDKRVPQPDAREKAEKLREDLRAFGGSFAEAAKAYSDDEETKGRGGLILAKDDPYFNPESYRSELAGVLRGMEVGQISPVFELGKAGFAFVKLEGRREAGPAPLEGPLYNELYNTLRKQKSHNQEDEWFHKALARSLIELRVEGVAKTLPVEFFFEEEPGPAKAEPAKAEPAPKAQPDSKAEPAAQKGR